MQITVGLSPDHTGIGNTHHRNPGTGAVAPLLIPDQIPHAPEERHFHGGRWNIQPAPDGFAPAPTVGHIPYADDGIGGLHRERA